ncbi:peptidoglycan DD-metalloendopeptidase family protein [Candidatus Dojkabacteria bacterium]|nr:peptidoglycan DD-metalloendopeptidase family protein [Candidatus Dojkabacteria bacterium]
MRDSFKKVFSRCMTIVFAASLALFVLLIIVCIVLGPQETEKSIKALFDFKTYKEDYKKIIPFLSKKESDTQLDKEKEASVLDVFDKRIIVDKSSTPALLVPSEGIAPRSAFLFTGPLDDGGHEGIDIWTNLNGAGMDGKTYGKGNPVYASCSGYVRKVWEDNGDVTVICDTLDEYYKEVVPSLKIKTLYGHMADQFSDEVYIYVHEGQRVNRGDLIGHQGNRCYWSPENRVVHLHFGVYDITNTKQVPLDPTPYIGVSCTTLNQEFKIENES